MKSNMKRLMAYLLVIFLAFGAFPLLSSSAGAEAKGRAAEIVIYEVSIVNATGISVNETPDNTIKTGLWNVSVKYNVTKDMDAWAEFAFSRADDLVDVIWNYTLGNVTEGAGGMMVQNGSFNFAAGTYYVNVTIGNKTNGTMSTMSSNMFTFGDVKKVEVTDFLLDGVVVSNHYAKELHTVSVVINNTGNLDLTDLTENTTVIVNITNRTNADFFEEYVNLTAPFYAGAGDMLQLPWTPMYEAFYTVNVTYNNSDCDDTGDQLFSTNFTVMDEVVYDFTYVNHSTSVPVNGNLMFDFNVTNNGNIEYEFSIAVNITDDDSDWSLEIYDNRTIAIGDTMSKHFENTMLNVGDYHVKAVIEGQATTEYAFSVAVVNTAPMLSDATVLADDIYVGDTVTLTVNYTDTEDDAPTYIKLFIDATWNDTSEMFENDTFNVTMTAVNVSDLVYTDGKQYKADWTAVLGAHEYAFVASDGEYVYDLAPVANDITVETPPRVDGTLSGMVSSGTGNGTTYITDAKVVIFNTTTTQVTVGNNTTNVTTMNFFNATTVAGGNYTKTLDFGMYTTYVNATGYNDSAESNFTLSVGAPDVVKAVSLDPWWEAEVVAPTTGTLSGMVTTGTGNDTMNISGAMVIIYYVEEVKLMNGTNVTGYDNVTHWFNATTDANGAYTKVLDFNTYTIYVNATGYVDSAEVTALLDATHLTATKDFAMVAWKPIVIMTYTITGTVTPADATVTFSGTQAVDHNTTSGAFTILEVPNGDYKLTCSATGYVTKIVNVTVADADKTVPVVLDEVDDGRITLPLFSLGLFKDKDGNLGEGLEVTITIDGVDYTATTILGIAIFDNIPQPLAGDKIVVKEDGEIVLETTYDPLTVDYTYEAASSSMVMWIIIIIIVVVVIIVVLVLLMKKKKPEDAGMDLEDEEEDGIGEDFDDDMGALEEDDGFDEFEPEPSDEEMEGVEDYAEDLEEFDDEEDFEDEDFDDYEDELDEDVDEDFDDEEFDDDFDDDEFDDDDDF